MFVILVLALGVGAHFVSRTFVFFLFKMTICNVPRSCMCGEIFDAGGATFIRVCAAKSSIASSIYDLKIDRDARSASIRRPVIYLIIP